MADSTQVLREQSGIQYGGPQDKSEADPRDSLLNIVFTGRFKRGRFDKPFKVTKANYRAKLGHDPKNLDYVAVEDALNAGAPFVLIVRLSDEKPGAVFSCAGATTSFRFNQFTGNNWDLNVNGTFYANHDNQTMDVFINALMNLPDVQFPISASLDGALNLFNEVQRETRVQFIPNSPIISSYQIDGEQENKAYSVDEKSGVISFCLAALAPPVIGVPQPG